MVSWESYGTSIFRSNWAPHNSYNLDRVCWCGNCQPHWFEEGWVCKRTYENQTLRLTRGFIAQWIKATPTNPQDGGEIDILAIYGHSVFETIYFDIYGFVREDLDIYNHIFYADSASDSCSGYISGVDLEIDFHFMGTADPQHQWLP